MHTRNAAQAKNRQNFDASLKSSFEITSSRPHISSTFLFVQATRTGWTPRVLTSGFTSDGNFIRHDSLISSVDFHQYSVAFELEAWAVYSHILSTARAENVTPVQRRNQHLSRQKLPEASLAVIRSSFVFPQITSPRVPPHVSGTTGWSGRCQSGDP